MIEYQNECCGCLSDLPCLGNKCPKMNVPHYICDGCGEETILYKIDGKQLCKECAVDEILDSLERVI